RPVRYIILLFLMVQPPPRTTLFPYTTLFRSPGTTILLEQGAVYMGPYNLPEKNGDDWIVIRTGVADANLPGSNQRIDPSYSMVRSEEHTSELQSRENLVCRLLLEKKKRDDEE